MNTSDCIVLAVLLAFSAYFSASETALSTVNKIRLKSYADNGSKKAKIALDIAENYDRTISTILVGNNVVNTASAALMTTVTTALFGASGAVIATAVTTVLVLVFGEILPKTYGKENSEKLALTIAGSMHFLIVLLTPVVSIFRLLQWAMVRLCSKGDKSPSVTEEELKYILDTIEEEGVMQEDEAQLVQSALDFNDVPVQKLLTHRVDLVAVDIHDSLDSIRQVVLEERFTRIPVYDGNIDHVIGILQSRDFLEALVRGGEIDLRSMLTEPLFVHKTKTAASMLAEFKRRKAHIAIVTDDYGGTMGIVTMEDLLETIVGDLDDEHEEDNAVVTLADGVYEVGGDVPVNELEGLLGEDIFENADCDTIGGFITETLGRIPQAGETLPLETLGYTLTVAEATPRAVTKVTITRTAEKTADPQPAPEQKRRFGRKKDRDGEK